MSRLPLQGLRILVTRPVDQAVAWTPALEAAGATVVAYPTIEVVPPPSWEPLDEALTRLDDYDWLIFTSASAARLTIARLPAEVGRGGANRPRVAAVGRETGRVLTDRGLTVALVPEDQRAEGLVDALGHVQPGTRVLFPQAVGGREELRNALLSRGCIVDVVPASQTIPLRDLPPPPPFDVATFASPSALRAFVAIRGLAALESAPLAVIGPTTAAAASALGLHPAVADAPTVEAMVRAIAAARSPTQGAA